MGSCRWIFAPGRLECIHCGRVVHTSSRSAVASCPVNTAPEQIVVQAGYAPGGPGTELKALLSGWPLYVTATEDCPCNSHAGQMDAWGPAECERRIDEIVGWLRAEAGRRGLPFLDAAGRVLVRRAIRNARRKTPNQIPARPAENASETGI